MAARPDVVSPVGVCRRRQGRAEEPARRQEVLAGCQRCGHVDPLAPGAGGGYVVARGLKGAGVGFVTVPEARCPRSFFLLIDPNAYTTVGLKKEESLDTTSYPRIECDVAN